MPVGQGGHQLAAGRERGGEGEDPFELEPDLLAVVLRLFVGQQQAHVFLLQVSPELPVELVGVDSERLLDGFFDVVGQEDLPVFPEKIADPLLSELALDELERHLAEAVGKEVELVHLVNRRDDVVDHRVPHHHLVEGIVDARHVLRQPLHEPERRIGAKGAPQRLLEEDGVLEDVGKLVGDELVESIRRLIHREDDPVLHGLGEGGDELGDEGEDDVGLLEFAVGLVENHWNSKLDLVVEGLLELDVGALRVGDDLLQLRLLLGVVIDVEVGRLVDVPVEPVVGDLVLAEGEGGGERGAGGERAGQEREN